MGFAGQRPVGSGGWREYGLTRRRRRRRRCWGPDRPDGQGVGPPSRICHRRARVLPARVWMRLRNMRLGASARLAPGPHARGARAPPYSPSKRAWKRTGPAVKTAWEAHFSLRRWMDVEDATPVGGGGAMAVPPRRDGSPSLVPPPPLRRGADDASGPSRHSKNCLCLEIQSAKTRQLSLGLLDKILVSTLLVVIQLRESGSQHPAVTVVVSCPRAPARFTVPTAGPALPTTTPATAASPFTRQRPSTVASSKSHGRGLASAATTARCFPCDGRPAAAATAAAATAAAIDLVGHFPST